MMLSRATKLTSAGKSPPINTDKQQRVEAEFHLEFYDYCDQLAIRN